MLFYPLVGEEDDASKQYLLPLELFSRPTLPGKDSRALRAHAVRCKDIAKFEFGRDGASEGALCFDAACALPTAASFSCKAVDEEPTV